MGAETGAGGAALYPSAPIATVRGEDVYDPDGAQAAGFLAAVVAPTSCRKRESDGKRWAKLAERRGIRGRCPNPGRVLGGSPTAIASTEPGLRRSDRLTRPDRGPADEPAARRVARGRVERAFIATKGKLVQLVIIW